MHNSRIFISGAVVISISLLTATLSAQNEFNIPDLNPSRIQNESTVRSDTSDLSSVPSNSNRFRDNEDAKQLPLINPSNSIYDNNLRATESTNRHSFGDVEKSASYDSQPEPPEPKKFSGRLGRFGATGQDPIQRLNPNRLVPEYQPANRDQSNQIPDQLSPQFNPSLENSNRSINRQSNPGDGSQQLHSIMTPTDSLIHSSGVVAASYNQPQQQTIPGNSQNIKNLLATYDVSTSQQPLPGVPVALVDMMKSTPVRYRMAMVQQYWETFFDWATLRNRQSHSTWLNQLPNPRTQAEQSLLQTAKSMAQNEVLAAEIQLARSQSKLQQLSQSNNQQLIPLPLNQPLVTKYNTHYEWYQQRNMIPAKLKGINEMLPRTHELLSKRAATVQQAESARNQAKNAFASSQASISDLLESGRVWQSSMQGFVGTVVSYNQAISDYALTITSPQKPLDQIVSMLVAKPKSVNEVAQRNSILQRSTRPQKTYQQSQQLQRFAQQPSSSQINSAGPNAGIFPRSSNERSQPTANSWNNRFGSIQQPINQTSKQFSQQQPANSAPKFQQPDANRNPASQFPSSSQSQLGRTGQSIDQNRGNVDNSNNNGFSPQPRTNNSFSGGSGGNFGG